MNGKPQPLWYDLLWFAPVLLFIIAPLLVKIGRSLIFLHRQVKESGRSRHVWIWRTARAFVQAACAYVRLRFQGPVRPLVKR